LSGHRDYLLRLSMRLRAAKIIPTALSPRLRMGEEFRPLQPIRWPPPATHTYRLHAVKQKKKKKKKKKKKEKQFAVD